MNIVFVVAIAENGVIGRDNALPWRISSDLKHFRALTIGKPVLMGRKTFVSIGKPLPGRTNIVVTRERGLNVAGAIVANSLGQALEAAQADALRRGVSDVMVIGGGEIFRELMPRAQRLEFTHVHAAPEGDAVFPPLDMAEWRETRREFHAAGPKDDHDFTTATYERT
jgi:dihydrofolate reductase